MTGEGVISCGPLLFPPAVTAGAHPPLTVILVFGQSHRVQSFSALSGHQILYKTKAWLCQRPNPFKEGCEFRDRGGGKEGSAVR